MAIPPFRYRSIRESRSTEHPVDGNIKLSPMVRMYDGRLPRQIFYGEMWEGMRRALKPKKRFKDRVKYYLKQFGQPMDQWEKWLQIEVSGGN